ncbi:hypothetical protein FACS1894211_01660 [Clostridia bacterium]|nr:hypothetical protein FACS1894211_01660 [Clostridia bacterium]
MKKKFIVLCAVMAIFASVLFFAGCANTDGGDKGPTGTFALSETSVTFTAAGQTQKITAKKGDTAVTDVTWTSANEAVATVADGVITAVSKGDAAITAKRGDDSATVAVKVEIAPTLTAGTTYRATFLGGMGGSTLIAIDLEVTEAGTAKVYSTSGTGAKTYRGTASYTFKKVSELTQAQIDTLTKKNEDSEETAANIDVATLAGKYAAVLTYTAYPEGTILSGDYAGKTITQFAAEAYPGGLQVILLVDTIDGANAAAKFSTKFNNKFTYLTTMGTTRAAAPLEFEALAPSLTVGTNYRATFLGGMNGSTSIAIDLEVTAAGTVQVYSTSGTGARTARGTASYTFKNVSELTQAQIDTLTKKNEDSEETAANIDVATLAGKYAVVLTYTAYPEGTILSGEYAGKTITEFAAETYPNGLQVILLVDTIDSASAATKFSTKFNNKFTYLTTMGTTRAAAPLDFQAFVIDIG